MKAFYKILGLSAITMMLGISSLHAQWDTIKNYHPAYTGERINDIFFIGSYGYAVGHQQSASYFQQNAIISKTTDGGMTWNTMSLPFVVGNDSIYDLNSVWFTTSSTGYVTAECVPTNLSDYLYGAVLKTTDGGLTWTSILSTRSQVNPSTGTHIEFGSVQFPSLYSGYVAATIHTNSSVSALVYSTTNGGATWNNSTAFSGTGAGAVFFNNGGIGCIAGGHSVFLNGPFINGDNDWYSDNWSFPGKIAKSTDWGNTWTTYYSDPNSAFSDIYFSSQQTGYTVGIGISGGEILKTTDGGQTWNNIHTFSNLLPRCVYFVNDTLGFVGGEPVPSTSAMYKTIDGGVTWTAQTDLSNANLVGRVVAIVSPTPVTHYALNDSISPTLNYSASILGNFPASSCSVFLGPDTTFCQQQGQLFATPGTPGNNYVFNWSPGVGLSDSTVQNPYVNHVYNQQYVVTMTDTVTGCSATDTIVVSAYEMITGPEYFCQPDSALLDFGPGATGYFWQFFTDTANNTTFINQNTQTMWATQQGYYLGYATFPTCGALTSYVQVLDTCDTYAWVSNVWPGDCNYDLVADAADVLNIGLGYNTSGATRPSATNGWYAQPMNDWTQNFTTCNYKHADANGDGVINMLDTVPIALNYGLTHPYRLANTQAPASAPTLQLVANYDTCGLNTLVTIDVRLGTSSIPVDSLYGISFRITADANLIDTTQTGINMNTTWLGTVGSNMFNFRKSFRSMGRIDAAESRDDMTNRLGGNGTIATCSIVTTDNLSGIAICHLHISDIVAVTKSEHYLVFNTVDDSVVIDSAYVTGIKSVHTPVFSVYPNPSDDHLTISTAATPDKIEITDVLGQTVTTMKPVSTNTVLKTDALANGIYFVRVYANGLAGTQKITVKH